MHCLAPMTHCLWACTVAGPTTLDDPRAANAVRRPEGRLLSPSSSVLSECPAWLDDLQQHKISAVYVLLLQSSCRAAQKTLHALQVEGLYTMTQRREMMLRMTVSTQNFEQGSVSPSLQLTSCISAADFSKDSRRVSFEGGPSTIPSDNNEGDIRPSIWVGLWLQNWAHMPLLDLHASSCASGPAIAAMQECIAVGSHAC